MKKVLSFLAAVFSLFLVCSCDVGLGAEVDLVAPEITVTSPKDGDNVSKKIRIEGTCSDNVKVTGINVVESRSGGVTVSVGKGVVQGNTWYIDAELEEGDRFIICTAQDAAGNSSPKSKAVLNLIVDETPASAKGWYVERGKNTQISFMTKEKLQSVDCGLVVNKFIPQNQSFSISGKFYDSISIAKIILHLYEDEETEPVISKTLTPADITTGSIYLPEWSYTHDELVAARASLNSGKHYLRVAYEVYDDANNRAFENVGYLLWYPESDRPGIEQQGSEENKLSINVGSSIPVYFFDDDEISEVRYSFITEAAKTQKGITLDNLKENTDAVSIENDLTEYPVQVKTTYMENGVEKTWTTGTYFLLLYVKDINGYETKRIIEVSLRDAKNPSIRITAPKENEKPSISADGSSFTITGTASDTTGCKNVRVAYIPNRSGYETAAQKQARAKELFIDGSKCQNNEFVKTYTFSSTKPAADSTGYVNESFSFTLNLLTDFPTEMNGSKFFMFVVEDLDSNQIFKQWVISADSDAPEFKFTKPNDMDVIDYLHKDLQFRFVAQKASGLGIKQESYVVKRNADSGTKEADCVYTFANNGLQWEDAVNKDYILLTVSKDDLKKWAEGTDGYKSDSAPIFNFECEDVVGNKGSSRMTVVLSPLPALDSITVDQRSDTYCSGTQISFQAKFTDTVKVSGNPRLKLAGIKLNGSAVVRYATYESGTTDSDTVKFVYTVQENETSDGISCVKISDDEGIDLNGGTIKTGTQGNGSATIKFIDGQNFWDSSNSSVKKVIKFDGVKPVIKSVTTAVSGGITVGSKIYAKQNCEVLVTIKFSKPVSISGNVNFVSNSLNFTQYSMSADQSEVTYSYIVGSSNNGNATTAFDNVSLSCAANTCFSYAANSSIKDKVGNGLYVADTTYDLNVVLDTTKPGVPSISGTNIVNNAIFNTTPVFNVTKAASDTDINKLEVSLNNGQSWIDCSVIETKDEYKCETANEIKIIKGGTYNIVARATDKAGNVSDSSTAIKITLNDQFPNILDIIAASENGNYKNGDVITFKVFLDDTLKPYTANDASLTFETITAAAGSTSKTIKVTPSGKDASGNDVLSSVLVFEHTVTDGDKYDGIHISGLTLNNLQDKYNNKQTDTTTAKINSLTSSASGSCYRTGIKVDGSAPVISSTVPANGKVATNVNSSGYLTVSVTFNEVVYKESGTITLQRKGSWGIPAVMTVDDFNKVYNSSALTAADREKLMATEGGNGSGNELVDTRTGIASGPYRKITHGLIKNSSTDELTGGAPDTDTKFVLDFNLGLYSGSTKIDPYGRGTVVSVDDIRKVFEKTGYHQHSLQMNSSKITTTDNKTYNIEFPVKVQEGIEWELIISEGAFRDEVGNLYKGMKSVNDESFNSTTDSSYSLWSNKVSIPVVRVDRYSHGYGAIEPKSTAATVFDTQNLDSSANTTNFVNLTVYRKAGQGLTDNTGGKIAPTGYVRVRIDTQTPGAAIKYRTFNTGAFDATTGKTVSGSIPWTRYVLNDNRINTAQATGTSTTSSENGYVFTDNSNSSQRCSVSEIPDATAADLTSKSETFTTVTPESNAGVIMVVGDGNYRTARKDYVSAYATLASAKTDAGASMTDSIIGAEGVFKTVIYSCNYDGDNQFNIEGGTFMGGEPNVSGFPVRDGESSQYSKNAYHMSDTKHQNIFNSYEFVSTNWAILLRESANSKNYPRSSYGQATYVCGYFHY